MNENSPAEYFHRGNLPPIKRIYSQAELDQTPWYYSVEMEPGKLTSGQTFSNVALTRTLLQRTDLEGKDCLDIGTMEGLVPTLMKRRGASNVVAYDRPSALTSRIEAVKDRFGVDFEFVSGVPLGGLAARLNHRTFDVVVMSGVLYHLFSPLSGLAFARGLLRNGGIMILETAAVIDDTPAMHWNANLRFFGEAYFFPSLACLDYFVRFLRMEIIDCAYFETHRIDGLRTARVAFSCRAIDHPKGPSTDTFLQGTLHTETDVAEHLNWENCNFLKSDVRYHAPAFRTLRHQFIAFRALRRLTRNLGMIGISNHIDRLIRERGTDYWQRGDCESIDIYKYCTRAKQQHVADRDTQLWLEDMA
jgi:2-polyprenyl-3-methyl-5-hydroxy-6-metoxy-1,4-benzoquinol methylase